MPDIRNAIVAELDRRGLSRRQFGLRLEREGVCTLDFAYRYLRGDKDANGRILGQMLDALGLRIEGGGPGGGE